MAIKTFATGEVLTASDTNTFLANAGLVYVTSTTVGSAVSSVTISNCFSSTYDNYRITVAGGTASVQSNIAFQLSGITGSVYYQLGYYQSSWGSSARADYASGAVTSVIASDGSVDGYATILELSSPNLAKRKFGSTYSQSANNQYSMPFQIASTSTATGFTLTPGSGTLTGGTITVYGYRKA